MEKIGKCQEASHHQGENSSVLGKNSTVFLRNTTQTGHFACLQGGIFKSRLFVF